MLTILLLAAVPSAAALPAAAQGLDELREVDTNGDGAIDVAEARAVAHARFAMADRDRNGALSEKEFTDMAMRRVSMLDTDGDGKVTRQEIRARAVDRWRNR
jgi:Ca2+-binding EF-hand superfamily protein